MPPRQQKGVPLGMGAKPKAQVLPPTDQTGQLFTAALLQAAQGGCECQACQLLRQISQRLTAQLLQGVQ